MGDERLIEVEVRQVVSGNGVRHLQLVLGDVIYTAEGCNLDQTEVTAVAVGTAESHAICWRESEGFLVVESMHRL